LKVFVSKIGNHCPIFKKFYFSDLWLVLASVDLSEEMKTTIMSEIHPGIKKIYSSHQTY